MEVLYWDICSNLHAMSDVAYKNGMIGVYSKPRTYNAECYLILEGKNCKRKGRCLIAKFE